MKILAKAVETIPTDNIIFSPKDIIMLLSEIEELKHCHIDVLSEPNGPMELIVGDYRYHLAD